MNKPKKAFKNLFKSTENMIQEEVSKEEMSKEEILKKEVSPQKILEEEILKEEIPILEDVFHTEILENKEIFENIPISEIEPEEEIKEIEENITYEREDQKEEENIISFASQEAPENTPEEKSCLEAQKEVFFKNETISQEPLQESLQESSWSLQLSENLQEISSSFQKSKYLRESWKQEDYTHLFFQLEKVQTASFFLKGQLLAEAKERFFEDNQKNWMLYCEESLRMNYTTVNQYIRVSQEFDVTTHHKEGWGFEHYKALLSLPQEKRSEILEKSDKISVKALRNLIKKESTNKPQRSQIPQFLKELEFLNSFKKTLSFENLTLQERWQLQGACQEVCHMLQQISSQVVPQNIRGASFLPEKSSLEGEDTCSS